MSELNKQVAGSVIEWLAQASNDVRQDDKEGLETAMQIIQEAFQLTEADVAKYSLKPSGLAQLVQVYQKTKASASTANAAAATPAPAPSSGSSTAPVDKAAAEEFKTQGNQAMAQKQYQPAVDAYTQAIAKDPTNPVYYSNRAAAYSQLNKHDEAIADANKATEVDPSFSKAYSRLGHAYFCKGSFQEAVDAYEKGLELDPANQVMKNSLATAKSRLASDAGDDALDALAGSGTRGAGAFPGLGGGAGGMPDLASMMSNPMFQQAAQSLMQNGGLEQLMNNPSIRQMAEQFGQGGGMPDISTLMNNPALANLAQSLGRGQGGPSPGTS